MEGVLGAVSGSVYYGENVGPYEPPRNRRSSQEKLPVISSVEEETQRDGEEETQRGGEDDFPDWTLCPDLRETEAHHAKTRHMGEMAQINRGAGQRVIFSTFETGQMEILYRL
jgi:hypothetical protein